MKLQDITAARDEAKLEWKEHQGKANHYRELYLTLDALVRLTRGPQKQAPEQTDTAEQAASTNGESPATRKDALKELIREKGGMTSIQIFEALIAQGIEIKKQYAYNLLTWLVKDGTLKRKDGKYYFGKE
jgi:hypothetical protein